MLHVLRLSIGCELILCDGQNTDFCARLETITAKPESVTFTIMSQSPSNTESLIQVTLFQGLPKGDKLDWIIEKCIEAGIYRIIPVCTARTVVKVKDPVKKAERFTRISESAAGQCMRGIIPYISPPINFSDALLEHDSNSLCLLAYEKERIRTVKCVLNNIHPRPISLWVGPEGGFDDSEVKALEDIGAVPISLGPRILRTETAGLVALAQILCIWEN